MKLYRFELSTWRDTKITRIVLEAEEKPKTYIVKNRWTQRISKSDIGIASGYSNEIVYLLEDDMEKAKSIFLEALKGKIESEKRKIENTIKYCNENIAKYEKAILEINNGLE